jgi:hypothetical protein
MAGNRKRAQKVPVTDEEIAALNAKTLFLSLNTQLRNAYLEQLYLVIRDDLRRALYADDSWSFWRSPNKKKILASLALLEKAKPKDGETYLAKPESLKEAFGQIAEKMSKNKGFCLSAERILADVENFIVEDIGLAAICQDAEALQERMRGFASTATERFATSSALSQRFGALNLALSCDEVLLPRQLAAVSQNASSAKESASTQNIPSLLSEKLTAENMEHVFAARFPGYLRQSSQEKALAAQVAEQAGADSPPADLWKTLGGSIKAIVDVEPFQPTSVPFLSWAFGASKFKKDKLVKAVIAAVENKDHSALEKAVTAFQAFWSTKENATGKTQVPLQNLGNQAALLSSNKVCDIRAKVRYKLAPQKPSVKSEFHRCKQHLAEVYNFDSELSYEEMVKKSAKNPLRQDVALLDAMNPAQIEEAVYHIAKHLYPMTHDLQLSAHKCLSSRNSDLNVALNEFHCSKDTKGSVRYVFLLLAFALEQNSDEDLSGLKKLMMQSPCDFNGLLSHEFIPKAIKSYLVDIGDYEALSEEVLNTFNKICRVERAGVAKVFSAKRPSAENLLPTIGSSEGIAHNCDAALKCFAKLSSDRNGSFSGAPNSRRSFCEERTFSGDSTASARH